jgi:hypothetical protein
VDTETPAGYFRGSVLTLVDLIQQERWSQPLATVPGAEHGKEITIVLLFCALQEALLEHFLRARMKRMGMPAEAQKLLFLRSQAFSGRLRLFEDLVGRKLKHAAKDIDADRFDDVLAISREAVKRRNAFMHRGHDWDLPIARDCVNAIPKLLRLFVEFHNEHVAGYSPP